MKRILTTASTCLTLLMLSQWVYAEGAHEETTLEIADEFVGELSLTQAPVRVDVANNLHCTVQESQYSYIPIRWSSATLDTDHHQRWVMPHAQLFATSSGDQLCVGIARIRREASTNGGFAVANVVVRADVRLIPTYVGCSRILVERATYTFATDVVLVSEDVRPLSGGGRNPRDCQQRGPVIF
jgi:hypothetical protein